MAIKIACAQCGFGNELGRIFCAQCGQKLELHSTSARDLTGRREFEFGRFLGRLAAILLPVLAVACLGLGLWPAAPLTPLFEASGAAQLPMKARALRSALVGNRRVTLEITEGEVNGYLVARARDRKLAPLKMDFKPGHFDLAGAFVLKSPVTNVAWLAAVRLPVTLDLRARFDGGELVVARSRIGHLPLIGPFKGVVTRFFAGVFNDVMREQPMFQTLSRVSVDDTKATLHFGR
jgi:hypothetical protein